MDLLERYLQAIGQYLPVESKADTLAEMRANLLEEMDDRAEDWGRPLDEADVAAILRKHGKPEVVALRYLPQRSLIGPTVFPFYALTMRRVLPVVVLVSFLVEAVKFAASSRESAAQALGDFALGVWPSLLITAAILTAIFAGIEFGVSHDLMKEKLSRWDPMKLPAVKRQEGAASPQTMLKNAIQLAVHCLWFAYVLWVPWHPFWLMGPGLFYWQSLHVKLSQPWHVYYALLIVLLTIQLVIRLATFVPRLARWVKPMDIAANLVMVVAIGYMCTVPLYFVAGNAAADAVRIVVVNHFVGLAMRIGFVFALLGWVKEIWEYMKRMGPVKQLAF